MRIDVVVVITGLDDQALRSRASMLDLFASAGTDIRQVVVSSGPQSVESEAELHLSVRGILEAVVRSQETGADGVVIWGGHDPAIQAARELADIPVIGPGMASMYLAASLASNFSLLVQLPNVVGIARRQVADLGLSQRCASIRSVDVPVLDLASDRSYPQILRHAIASVDDDGADAICFGCMAMTVHSERLAEDLNRHRPGTIVVNPGLAAIRWAEMTISMGLTHSRRSYPAPSKPVQLKSE